MKRLAVDCASNARSQLFLMLLFQHTFHMDSGRADTTFPNSSRKKYRADPKPPFQMHQYKSSFCRHFVFHLREAWCRVFLCACSIHAWKNISTQVFIFKWVYQLILFGNKSCVVLKESHKIRGI